MKTLAFLLLFAAATLVFTSCTSGPPTPLPTPAPSGNPNPLALSHRAAQGANDFAFRLAATLAQDTGDDNLIVSPFSVWLPLAALVEATQEPYQSQLLEALGAAGLDPAVINQTASRMIFDLTNEGHRQFATPDFPHHNPLRIANAIFLDHDFTLRQSFAESFAYFYHGEILNANFTCPSTLDAINSWACYHTDGLIPHILDELPGDDSFAVILNAIYFSDRWRRPFATGLTHRDIFHGPAGESEAYFMELRLTEHLVPYFENYRLQAIHLPFTTGGAMTILLPKEESAAVLLSSMTAEYFDYIVHNSVNGMGRLVLPRFSIESTIDDLADVLTAIGVPLFDRNAAPLTGGIIYENNPVWLSDAIQKAMIEVDEEGTTAAAVTSMVFNLTMGPPPPDIIFEMICNRPFVFVLHRNTAYGGNQVLFVGMVNCVDE